MAEENLKIVISEITTRKGGTTKEGKAYSIIEGKLQDGSVFKCFEPTGVTLEINKEYEGKFSKNDQNGTPLYVIFPSDNKKSAGGYKKNTFSPASPFDKKFKAMSLAIQIAPFCSEKITNYTGMEKLTNDIYLYLTKE